MTAPINELVRDRYARAALSVTDANGCLDSGCCGTPNYSADELASLPATAALASMGCGNPIMVADLHQGERVLDLGSGGGIDVLLSASRVGPAGGAIGLDMTDEMLALAQRNAAEAERHQRRIPQGPDRGDSLARQFRRCGDQQLRDQSRRRQAGSLS